MATLGVERIGLCPSPIGKEMPEPLNPKQTTTCQTAVSAAIFFAGKDREKLGAPLCPVKRIGSQSPRPHHFGDVLSTLPLRLGADF